MTTLVHALYDSIVAPGVPPVLGVAFNVADVHAHDLQASLSTYLQTTQNFQGIVNGIHIRLTNLGAATKLTMRLCADAAGDYTLVPDTEATLVTGITTATTGCVAFKVDLPLFQILAGPGNGFMYLFAKVDAGTPTFAQSCISWSL